MKWNLRLAAANRGIWKASELQRMPADVVISAGKMSRLWSGRPASIKLDDLDVLCAVVGCGVEELLIAEPARITRPAGDQQDQPGQQPAAPARPGPGPGRSRPGAVTAARSRRPDEPHRPGRAGHQLPGKLAPSGLFAGSVSPNMVPQAGSAVAP